jgi:hypothetical protein
MYQGAASPLQEISKSIRSHVGLPGFDDYLITCSSSHFTMGLREVVHIRKPQGIHVLPGYGSPYPANPLGYKSSANVKKPNTEI